MGIINMMIVIPMLIQNISFGYILKHFLNNDPGKAISFAGIFLLIASGLTFFIQAEENENTNKKNETSALKPNH
jgi:maltose/moltooligosaccharide transporter